MPENSKKVFIVEGLRSPFVKAGKEFSEIHPSFLASQNLKEFLSQIQLPGEEIEEVILGNSFILPDSSNIARVVALQAGLPIQTPATTTARNCASSLESLVTGLAKIQAGIYDSVLAGGVESMSHSPLMMGQKLSQNLQQFLLAKSLRQKIKSLFSLRPSQVQLISPLIEGLKDPFTGYSMGETAELLAREFSITREEQDNWAFLSHKKALEGEEKLKSELFPFVTEKEVIDKDQGPKAFSKKRLAKFPPYFDKKYGTVSIANSCPVSDGSALLLLMSEERLKALGLKPLASIVTSAFVGLEPKRMGLGPIYASSMALKKAGLQLKDMDLIEINEAFSAQVLAVLKAFASKKFSREKLNRSEALGEINPEILNVNGGAIAIGHPISATGARLVLTLAKEMKRRNVQFGLASLCIGGGQGGAVILEQAP